MRTKSVVQAELKSAAQDGLAFIEKIKSEGRDFDEWTEAEAQALMAKNDRLDALKAELDEIKSRHQKSSDLVHRITGGNKGGAPDMPPLEAMRDGKAGGNMWAKSVAHNLSAAGEGMGVKTLLSGQISTPPTVEVAPLPDVPTRLLDLIPRENLDENTFEYLRQVARENNAAVVPDGETKPTSTYTFEEVEDRARVIAHLSEPFPIRYADDYASMIQILDGQMQAGVRETIEHLIVNGTGTGEEWKGILNTTGTLQVDYSTDLVTTLRRSRTLLENTGQPMQAVVMNPADIESLEMLRKDGTNGGFLLDTDAYERIFGQGVRGIPSLAVPEGTAIVGNWSVTRLMIRQGTHSLAATQAGDLFDKNQMKVRTEGRFGFKFMQPGALAVVDLVGA